MKRISMTYGQVLFELGIKKESLQKAQDMLHENEELLSALENPTITKKEKENVVEKLFSDDIKSFLKVVCDNDDIVCFDEAVEYYDELKRKTDKIIKAEFNYVTMPKDEQLERIKQYLMKQYQADKVELTLKEEKDLIGGFVLKVGDHVYDNSLSGKMKKITAETYMEERIGEQVSIPETVVSVLKDQIETMTRKLRSKKKGRIIQIADGIATVYGMDQAMYGELVIFETGVHGLVLNVERNCIGCVLLGSDHGLMEGSKVARTGVQADIPVGDAMIGRVVNAIGEPIDGKGEIKTDERRPIEHEAAGVIDRKSVDQPLQTGILAIDSMFPIDVDA